jgi:predicted DsbA family dithiol-disulfide isomerase
MAVESAHVTADVIEAMEFPDLARRYSVRGVPKIVINDHVEFVGTQPESEFVKYIKESVAQNGDESEPSSA